MLKKEELAKLKRFSLRKSNLLLHICEDIDGKFCIRPIRWSGSYKKGKLSDGECLARFDIRKDAEDTLINVCGYPKDLAVSLSA